MIPVDAANNPFKTSRRFHRGVITVYSRLTFPLEVGEIVTETDKWSKRLPSIAYNADSSRAET
jgi:hypothetical protein